MQTLDIQSEREADYRIIELTGRPAAIGQFHAEHLSPVQPPFRRWPWENDHAFLRSSMAIVGDIAPWLPEELGTFAELHGMPAEQGLFVRAGALNHGCSAIVWRAPNGHVLAGRTYDFYVRMRTRHLLITEPEQGYKHISMNGGLIGGRYDGVNEHGLFVALHKVMTNQPDEVRPGVPYHLVPRIVLQDCRTAEEAADLIERMPHLASFNYTLADPSGTMLVLECYPGQPVQRREAYNVLGSTNHYTSSQLAPFQGRRSTEASRRRADALEALAMFDDPWSATLAAVADHRGDVCCHREFGATLWAGVFDLTARQASYCFGAPCRNPLQRITFPGDAA